MLLLVVVILLVHFILIPLCDLTLKEQVLFFVKLAIYLVTFLWIAYMLFTGKPV